MAMAISAQGIGKQYRRTPRAAYQNSLRDALGDTLRGLLSRRSAGRPSRESFWALRDVSFGIGHGENVGIIGMNGAGKSTLLKLLSRIAAPTTGRIRLEGRVGALLEVGTGFHRELTGRENIFLYGSILGMSRREIAAKFDAIVAFAEIGDFIDMPGSAIRAACLSGWPSRWRRISSRTSCSSTKSWPWATTRSSGSAWTSPAACKARARPSSWSRTTCSASRRCATG
jgi:ABC-type polysaccharide/polyol phosphate transport system ATPase subunit